MSLTTRSQRDRLLSVIRRGDIDPAFQPIVDLQSGRIWGFEGLSRPGPTSGFAHAGELFEAAEREQLLWELEEVSRNRVLAQAAHWPNDTCLFLNTTPVVFADKRFAQSLDRAVRSTPALDASRVVLEITELSEQQHIDGLLEQVQALKDSGFDIAIDDVGIGASGLSRIMRLRPSWLKLDRSFCHRVSDEPLAQNMVRFLVHFARLSNVKVVAEGIERHEDLATLIELGVRFGQGYLLARPGPVGHALSTETAAAVRRCWEQATAKVVCDPRAASLRRLCTRTPVLDAALSIRESLSLMQQDDRPGSPVVERDRLIGWCPREHAERAVAEGRADEPARTLVVRAACILPADASVVEGARLVCARSTGMMGVPLLLVEGSRFVGVVTTRDLLQALAAEAEGAFNRRVSPTGLPGRVMADEHLAEMFESHAGKPDLDAAVVDFQRLADFNAVFGYDLGDRLIRTLVTLLQQEVVADNQDIYLAHLGDDRFLITGPGQLIRPRIARVVDRFDSGEIGALGGDPGDTLKLPSPIELPRVSLRALVVSGFTARLAQPKDFFAVEESLRQRAKAIEAANWDGRSLILNHDPPAHDAQQRRIA